MRWQCDTCRVRIWGADPVDLEEAITDHQTMHDNENDPGAPDLGGQRTGACETDSDHQQEAETVMENSTPYATALAAITDALKLATVGYMQHKHRFIEPAEERVTHRLTRTAADVVVYSLDAEVTVFEDVVIPAVPVPGAADLRALARTAAKEIMAGRLPVGARLQIMDHRYQWDADALAAGIRRPEWEADPEDVWTAQAGAGCEFESIEHGHSTGDVRASGTVRMTTAYSDYLNDPDAEPFASINLERTAGPGRRTPFGIRATDPEELRALATVLTRTASDLEAAQDLMTCERATRPLARPAAAA